MATKYSSKVTPANDDGDVDTFNYDIADLHEKTFDFENLALEGGGVKTICYASAFQVLHDVGILQKIKRIAGVSGGAVAAMLLALGYSPSEIRDKVLSIVTSVEDAGCGCCSFLPNIVKLFGYHPGKRLLTTLKEAVAEKMGDGNATFRQLYERRQVELCILVTNLNTLSLEYCHVKTAPDHCIADAVHKSASLPGFIAPHTSKATDGKSTFFADGGLLCNYPLHVFDGWYLSMNSDNSFFKQFGTDEPRFGKVNPQTIGMVVYSADEVDFMRLKVHHGHTVPRPKTKLALERGDSVDTFVQEFDHKMKILNAAHVMAKQFQKHDRDGSDTISLDELNVIVDSADAETQAALEVLFGEVIRAADILKQLDQDGSQDISFDEFISFLERGCQTSFQECFKKSHRMTIDSLGSYAGAVVETIFANQALQFYKPDDESRTIGIHTDYISTLDFEMQPADYLHLKKQTMVATITFLRNWLKKQHDDTQNVVKGVSEAD